ncbi:MAG: translocation/assembly module TamB domain-containing protein [Acidobacteria bacterium]|nr:translocation/assembly module TamB domain-containing protein [Acidobacteriota bacterium]
MRLRFFRIAGLTIGGIVLAGVAFLHLPPGRTMALRQLQSILAKQGVQFDASGIDYNLLSMRLRLRDVSIAPKQDMPALARIGAIDVDASLADLIRGKVVITNAALTKPEIFLLIDANGRSNLPELAGGDSSKKRNVILEFLSVDHASLRFQDQKNKTSLYIPDWQITADGNRITGRHRIYAQTKTPAHAEFEDRKYTIDNLQATLDLGDRDLKVAGLNAALMGASLRASGSVRDFTNPVIDARAEVTGTVEGLALQLPAGGTYKLQLAASGTIPALKANGQVTAENVRYEKYTGIRANSAWSFDRKEQIAVLNGLRLSSPLGNANGDATLALNSGASSLRANLNGIRLDAASRLAKSPVTIASTASGTISAQWPGMSWQKSTATARLSVQPLRAAGRDTIPVEGTLEASLRNGAGTVRIQSLRALGASAEGTVAIDPRQSLSGAIRIAASDLARSAESIRSVTGSDFPELAGAASADIAVTGTVNNPVADLHLRDAVLRWEGQEIQVSGNARLAKNSALDLTASVHGAALPGLLKTDLPITGAVNLDARITGTIQAPRVVAKAQATDLVAYGQPFGTLKVDAVVSPERIATAQFELAKADGESLTGQAAYTIADGTLTGNLTSTPLRLTTFMIPGQGPVTGAVQLTANTTGPAKEPIVEGTVQARDLTFNEVAAGDLNAKWQYARERVQATIDAPRQKLTIAGSAGTQEPYPFEVKIDAQQTDLASLPLPKDTPITGHVTLHAEGSGDAGKPKSIRAAMRAEKLDFLVNNQPVTTGQPLVARLENGIVHIDEAVVRAAGTQVVFNGDIPLEPDATGAALSVNANADLAVASDVLSLKEKGITASGQLTARGAIKGSLKAVEPDLTVTMNNGFVALNNNPPVRNIHLEAAIRNGAAAIADLSALWTGAAIKATGTVPLGLLPPGIPIARTTDAGPAQFQASVTGLDLSRLQGVPEGLTGKAAVSVDLTAPRPTLEAVAGKLRVDEFIVDYNRVHIAQAGVSTLQFANGTATVERFNIEGTGTKVTLSGSAKLLEPRTMDMRLNGTSDIALASMFEEQVRAQGPAAIDIAARGPLDDPRITGSVTLRGGELAMRSPRIQADRINLRLDVDGREVKLSQLDGQLNGGRLTGSGALAWQNGTFTGPGLALKTDGVYLDIPANLRTVSDVDIKLAPVNSRVLLSGSALIREGSYTEPLNLDQGLFNIANRTPELDLTEERNRFLDKLDYNVAIKTEEPMVVDNNLAKAEVEVEVRLLGEYYEPGLTGRVTLLDGGELNLNERKYLIDRGVVTFVSERRIEPSFDILARTQAAGYDITLGVQGSGKERETTLTSDPPLPEPDIASILLTGRTLDRLQGSETDIAKEQVLSYLTGRVGGSVGRGIEQATGLSQVRIEPNLIANESDPSARLTVGQNLTRQLSLIYSMNLTDSGDQIIVGQYDFARRFRARALKQSDNSYRIDFSRAQEFGGDPPPPRTAADREKRVVGAVGFDGQTLFTEKQLGDWLSARTGKQYDFFRVRKGLDKISNKYADAGLLESKVRLQREAHGSTVDLHVDITPGLKVEFIYEGFSPSRSLRNRIRDLWVAGVFDVQRAEDAAAQIRKELVAGHYVQAQVDYKIDISSLQSKRVTFDVQSGHRFGNYRLAFAGAKGVSESELRGLVKDQQRKYDAVLDPQPVIDLVGRYYREQGYLDAKVAKPELVVDQSKDSALSVFAIDEGPKFTVAALEFKGNSAYETQALAKESTLHEGDTYAPRDREETISNLRRAYSRKGYNEAEVSYLLARTDTPGTVRLIYMIKEGQQSVVDAVSVAGNRHTSPNLVNTQLALKPGDPLNMDLLSRSRTNLYSTGAYSLVDIDRVAPAVPGVAGNPQPVNLVVKVREVRPFLVNYGGYYDTDRGPGGIVDVANRNMLGSARTAGVRVRYDSDLQEGRLYFTQPLLRRFPLRTTGSSFVRREVHEGFNTDRVGFSVLQESRFRRVWLLNYGYRWEKTRTYENVPDPLFDARILVAPFTASLSRDTRDDILDASRGQFISNAIEYAPTWSGSELNFVKYFGQYFHYHPFDRPKPLPMQKGLRKSRLVYAGGVRVGLAGGLNGQDLIPGHSSSGRIGLGERFFAGGGTTIRGFKQDGIGPRLSDGISPTGGDALFIMNHEMRFPLYKIFDGVGFLDIGNVYERASSFRPWEVRKAGGVGIRIRTPYFLIRFDYGVKLDRKPGEARARPFFSIGQAF